MLHNQPFLLAIILCLLTNSCRDAHNPAAVYVAAASSLVKVSEPIGETFERSYGNQVIFSFGASGNLEQQIRHGAPFDVYMPAAPQYSQALAQDGFVEGELQVFALGRLVAWSGTFPLTSLKNLTENRIGRIAIANPEYAPYGRAARQVLESIGAWSEVQPKLVFADSVAHAFQMAETGNVEVALVAAALVPDTQKPHLPVDPHLHGPIEQTAALLRDANNKAAAQAFLQFLRSAETLEILTDYGYALPQEP